ncbi:hypothetical protein [Parasediminibacterium sp. JCM 36343]|uniref:hypothetical protein n=1 Tax=Parasediminibacterium sp. JCM 36343 TaxID=3374279 RepID=UPI0039787933
MKNIVCFIIIVLTLCSCGLFRPGGAPMGCPTGAIGAEKLNTYINQKEASKVATKKTDPVSGKTTTKKKGIRTGELSRPPKPTKEEKEAARKKREEQKAIERQLKQDAKDAKRNSKMPY